VTDPPEPAARTRAKRPAVAVDDPAAIALAAVLMNRGLIPIAEIAGMVARANAVNRDPDS